MARLRATSPAGQCRCRLMGPELRLARDRTIRFGVM
jgi:hypothetical protein